MGDQEGEQALERFATGARGRIGKILYVGYLEAGQTSLHRLQALESLGYEVGAINAKGRGAPAPGGRLCYRAAHLLFRRGLPVPLPDLARVNAQLCQHAGEGWDALWLDKPLAVWPAAIKRFRRANPRALVIAYSPDDMAARHNQSVQFLALLGHLDAFVTTKSYNVAELRALGARQVFFVDNAYDPATHRPLALTPDDRERLGGPLGFIGNYEAERACAIDYLARQGIPVRIWGPADWAKFRRPHPGLRIEGREALNDDYARAIGAFDINLCFLRKINRDQQTTRSIEIPACGGFMLAERTAEHTRLFEEGREAEFFSTPREMLDKTRYYLEHPAERQRIAAAGRARCLSGGYNNASRLGPVLARIEEACLAAPARTECRR